MDLRNGEHAQGRASISKPPAYAERGGVRRLAVLSAAVFALTGLTVVTTLVNPAAAAAPPSCADKADTETAALAISAACGSQVEILSARSETDQVFANADGSLTLRRHVTPQRVRHGDKWVPVDPTLRIGADGLIRPVAVPAEIAFSGGGTAPLVTLAEGASRLELSWPAPLPKPALVGDTATYAEVFPGVDLRMSASVEGFQQILVVKDRHAAQNPALSRIATKVATHGLSLRAGAKGRVDALDASGKLVFFSDGAFMWDSPSPAVESMPEFGRGVRTPEGTAAVHDPDAPRRIEAMPVELTGGELAVRPVREMLADPATLYPVYIDPAFNRGSGTNWTTVNSCSTGTSYWTTSRDTMRVGRNPTGGCKHRAFVNIPVSDMTGSLIKSASFFSNMDHSSPCWSPTPEVRLNVTTQQWIHAGNAVTWANTDDYATYWGWVIRIVTPDSANEAQNVCTDRGDKLVEWGGPYVADVVQWFTNQPAYSTITFGIYATDESTVDGWKKFDSDSSYLQANYNRPPNVPTGQSITDCTVICASPAVVSRRDPQLRATATDPDGGNLNLYFAVQKADGTAVVTSPAVAVASGAQAQWRITPALPNDGGYRWQVTACDADWGDCSGPSGWFSFTVDSQAPPVPSVTPANPALYFPDDGSGSSSGGIGIAGTFNLSGDQSVYEFTWRLDGGNATTVAATGTNPRTASVTVLPPMDMTRTLTVTAKDFGGLTSTRTYTFRVASPEPLAGYWNLNETAADTRDFTGIPNAVHHDGTATNVTWVDLTVPGGAQNPRFRGVASFDGSGSISMGHPVLATVANPQAPTIPRSFTVATWVRFDGTVAENQYRTAVSQRGANKSLFELGYQAGTWNNFCFSMFATDVVGAAGTRACVTMPVVTGEWVHLAGVYDDSSDTMRLYVHRLDALGFVDLANVATATASFSSTWSATGTFLIGCGYNGALGAHWKGVMDEVYAAQYAATLDDIQAWAQRFELSD